MSTSPISSDSIQAQIRVQPEEAAAFQKSAAKIGISQVAQEALRGNAGATGLFRVKLSDKEFVFYNEADYTNIADAHKIFKAYETIISKSGLTRDEIDSERAAINAYKEAHTQVPEEVMRCITALESKLNEAQVNVLPKFNYPSIDDSDDLQTLGIDEMTLEGSTLDVEHPGAQAVPVEPFWSAESDDSDTGSVLEGPLSLTTPTGEESTVDNNLQVINLKRRITDLRNLIAEMKGSPEPLPEEYLKRKHIDTAELKRQLAEMDELFETREKLKHFTTKENPLADAVAYHMREIHALYHEILYRKDPVAYNEWVSSW